jgi:hypothetical protein
MIEQSKNPRLIEAKKVISQRHSLKEGDHKIVSSGETPE